MVRPEVACKKIAKATAWLNEAEQLLGRPLEEYLATGLRNRIAHGYALLEHRRLHHEASRGIEKLRNFLESVIKQTEGS